MLHVEKRNKMQNYAFRVLFNSLISNTPRAVRHKDTATFLEAEIINYFPHRSIVLMRVDTKIIEFRNAPLHAVTPHSTNATIGGNAVDNMVAAIVNPMAAIKRRVIRLWRSKHAKCRDNTPFAGATHIAVP